MIQFPHIIHISPDLYMENKYEIANWLEENLGCRDQQWTWYPILEIKFKDKADAAMFSLTWI